MSIIIADPILNHPSNEYCHLPFHEHIPWIYFNEFGGSPKIEDLEIEEVFLDDAYVCVSDLILSSRDINGHGINENFIEEIEDEIANEIAEITDDSLGLINKVLNDNRMFFYSDDDCRYKNIPTKGVW